jgi:hypothetical protein
MLAQSFRTAAQLKLTQPELEVLIKVLGMLERGEIKALPQSAGAYRSVLDDMPWQAVDYAVEVPEFFDMRRVIGTTDCGTSCCILGWAQYVGTNGEFISYQHRDYPLDCLFYPAADGVECTDPQQGAMALRNYLTTGWPGWREVMRS